MNEIQVGYDPFSDDVDAVADTRKKIGTTYIYLDSIYYLMDIDEDLIVIIDDAGQR